ncbi:hypothetical protein [Pantoea cypripedii]|uniref:Uncharacterized protein n=1 Tax=Pantoea cypripedii TaxID=55209 RepID=A0A6B9G3K1_PANCY|nr:hypothetical protein [Pantoea cypripedii]QGY32181.1 hypothetical protein CUN67_24625 [Pantoea cypripedii]
MDISLGYACRSNCNFEISDQKEISQDPFLKDHFIVGNANLSISSNTTDTKASIHHHLTVRNGNTLITNAVIAEGCRLFLNGERTMIRNTIVFGTIFMANGGTVEETSQQGNGHIFMAGTANLKGAQIETLLLKSIKHARFEDISKVKYLCIYRDPLKTNFYLQAELKSGNQVHLTDHSHGKQKDPGYSPLIMIETSHQQDRHSWHETT